MLNLRLPGAALLLPTALPASSIPVRADASQVIASIETGNEEVRHRPSESRAAGGTGFFEELLAPNVVRTIVGASPSGGAVPLQVLALAELAPEACPPNGEQGVAVLHRRWILEGWERAPGDGRFSFREKLGRYYDWESQDVVLYDDFDPQHRVARSAAAYAAIWEPIFNTVRSARHVVSDEPAVLAGSGDQAAFTMEFAALIEGHDSKVTPIRTRSSLVWRCRDGEWRIVREHNSTRIVRRAEVKALFWRR